MSVIQTVAGATILYLVTKIIYNIYFHSLSRYQGPFLWRAFQFPSLSVMLTGDLPYRIKELHDLYGPIVRIAPNELSIIDERAWKDIFQRREFLRPPQWGARPPGVEAHNLISAPADVHARFRRALAPAFSDKALVGYEPLIRGLFDKLIGKLDSKIESKIEANGAANTAVVDIVEWINFTTFDIIGELCWGKSFDCVDTGKGHAFISVLLHFKAALIGTFIKHYPALDALMPYITPKSALSMLHNVFDTGHERIQQRIADRSGTRSDILSHVLQYNESNPPSSTISQEEIEFNALTIIVAGSETLTTALSGALHHLLSHPPTYEKLCTEIRSAFESERDITASRVSSLPYLNAVLNETLRLCPPIPDGMRRAVPKGGAIVAGNSFTEGTVLGISCWSMFQSERNFSEPTVFAPERWLEAAESEPGSGRHHNVKAFQPFALGPHGCIGQNLAWLEMRLLLSLLLFHFDLGIAPQEEGMGKGKMWAWTDQKIYWTWDKKPLFVQIKRRI